MKKLKEYALKDLLSIGQRIKTMREVLGFTQKQVSERVGTDQATLSLIESGKKRVSLLLVMSLIKEFNLNPVWLIEGEGEVNLMEHNPTRLYKENDLCFTINLTDGAANKATAVFFTNSKSGWAETGASEGKQVDFISKQLSEISLTQSTDRKCTVNAYRVISVINGEPEVMSIGKYENTSKKQVYKLLQLEK